MKRYLLFIARWYYPMGGMMDFVIDKDTIEECKQAYESYIESEIEGYFTEEDVIEVKENFFAHIYDTKERKYVWEMSGTKQTI